MLRIAFNDEYILKLPPGHKFPIEKYGLIPEQLISEGIINSQNLFSPSPADLSNLSLTHSDEYLHKLINLNLTDREIRKIGFPQSAELIEREFIITQGTIQGSLYALESGLAFNIAGGTHHAYSGSGEGFCLLNDAAVATNFLLNRNYVSRVLIIDLDVHQGNGTAKIFENIPEVFTFSMHGRDNYPLIKEKSDIDIPLLSGTDDHKYLSLLKKNLPVLIRDFKPDFMFYISGVDILESDRWGKLSVTKSGCMERDRLVFQAASNNNIPIMVSMGGGYSPDISDIVEAHCNTFRTGIDVFQ